MNNILKNIELNQNIASNPNYSIWVNANAGTGKTKVLVDRILRILLNGTSHYKILCITYTNAAASEINQRILNILSRWSYIEVTLLIKELDKIGVKKINESILTRAKSLCNIITDSNIPLNIYTIHRFCQNILNNYTIEANIKTNFRILENNPIKHLEIYNEVYNELLLHILESKSINLNVILQHYNDTYLEKLVKDILKYTIDLSHLEKTYKDNSKLKKVIFNLFQVIPENNYYQYKLHNCSNESFDYSGFLNVVEVLNSQYNNLTPTEKKYLEIIQEWLNLNSIKRTENFDLWYGIFFTKNNTQRKRIFSNKVLYSELLQQIIYNEIQRLECLKETLANIQLAESNYELLKLSILANKIYLKIKKNLNFLDYNDLLQLSYNLLQKENISPWIFYNINQSISHILIDEAQDTSPIQWEILKCISKEIFSNPNQNKSIFIVGDLKQSIYSFQGAKPENLVNVKEYIKNIVISNGYIWEDINLKASFRSSKAVLDLVNQVSNKLFTSNMYKENEIYHECVRNNIEGYVEIWPLIAPIKNLDSNYKKSGNPENSTTNKNIKDSTFKANNEVVSYNVNKNNIYIQQAQAISEKIIYLIKNKLCKPKDIMILSEKRSNNLTLVNIIKFLKNHHIPTSGLDKVSINTHLAILDIISICKFILQPLYNLNLANLLKSPIFNFSDEELTYLIKENNKKFLWEILKLSTNPKVVYARNRLHLWMQYCSESGSLTNFFTNILYKDDLYDTYIIYFGIEVKELFNELLNLVNNFETTSSFNTLEHFIHFFENTNPVLSKEIDPHANEVKFFTIHGSKGLEANTVFLVDTVNNLPQNKIISTGISDMPIIFKLSKIKGYTSALQENLFNTTENALEDERKRLLYVALTRAKKFLYISSITNNIEKISEKSFYSYINNSINKEKKCELSFFENKKFGFIDKFAVVYK